MTQEIPNDENGDVLRRLVSGGDNLTKPRDVAFHFLFSDREQAIGFIELLADKSLEHRLRWYEEKDVWECTVTKDMVPTHSTITEFENRLIALAQPLEGVPDGWGCFAIQ